MIDRKSLNLGLLCVAGIVFAALLTYLVYKIWKYIYARKNVGASSSEIETLSPDTYYPHNVPIVPIRYTTVPAQEPTEEYDEPSSVPEKKSLRGRSFNILKNAKQGKPFEPDLSRDTKNRVQSMSMHSSYEDIRKVAAPTPITSAVSESAIQEVTDRRVEEKFRRFQQRRMANKKSRRVIDLRGNSITEEMFNDSQNPTDEKSPFPSESMSSSCESSYEDSQQNDSSRKAGKIRFTTKYNIPESKLQVRIIKAFDIAPGREMEDIKPFARVSLYPGKKQSQNTQVKKEPTKEPFFNETIIFQGLQLHDICTYKIKLKVCNYIRVGKKEVLGEGELNLSLIDHNNETEFTISIYQVTKEAPKTSITVSVNHEFNNKELCVIIHEAHVPRFGKPFSSAYPFVTLELFKEDDMESRKQTSTKKKTMNPIYNENFNFPLTLKAATDLRGYSLTLSLRNNGKTGSCKELGRVSLGLSSKSESGRLQWEKIVDLQGVPCKAYHLLAVPNDL